MDPEGERVRLAELVAALSLGVDLGFGQPMEHVLRQCRIALRIAELAGLDEEARSAIYYSALLVNVGCHSDAHEQAYWFGDDIALKAAKYDAEPFSAAEVLGMLRMLGSGSTPLHRLRVGLDFVVSGRKELDRMIAGHAALARSLGEELGLDDEVLAALDASYERWDGRGSPGWPEQRSPSPRASRTWRSSSRWPTAPTASRRRSRWRAAAPGPSSTPRWSSSSRRTPRRCSTSSTSSTPGTR